MNKHFIFILALGLDCLILSINAQESKKKLTSYVNPFIGTGSKDIYSPSGNTFPGATTPFGLVQLSPDTKDAPYNPSGYDYSHNEIAGFSHTHLSGTGCPDLYDVLVMPGIGDFHKIENGQKLIGYISRFDHAEETARPGYYQVKLLDYNINAELTVTEHVGLHQYTFPESNNANIIIDLAHRISKEISWIGCNILTSQIRIINNKTIEGFRILTGWTDGPRKVYFRAEFSKPFNSSVLWNNGTELENQNILNGRELKAVLNFSTVESEKISIKVALSTVSCDNAQLNMQKELPAWNFENVCKSADSLWENELQKIRVDGTKEQMEIFYTSMYHAFVQPNNLADVNGEYTGTDMVTRNAPDRKHYSTFSLWDIYRAAHPLYSLIQPARNAEFVNSMIRQYETMGFLPIWQLWGQENYCMIGNHAIPIIVDAILNGLPGIDSEEAYKAVLNSSLNSHENSPFKIWEKYGYIPEDILSQSVSITEEMAFNDWCVAQLAKKLGKNEDYQRFMKRAEFFKNLFDISTHFLGLKIQMVNG
ncbi:MAG: glycoside hydrolase family 92 protein [Bacteroidetes bacterium]|nr:glycoside hydrolase family 92 protein [Bacteroidota bacterium]